MTVARNRVGPRGPLMLLSLLLLALVLPLASGCRPRARAEVFDQGAAAEHAARLEKWLRKHPDDHEARLELAHTYWLHLAKLDRATAQLDKLSENGSRLPTARFSRAILAQSHLDVDRVFTEAAALIREAPGQPNAQVRARALALAGPAARLLEATMGLRPGDDEEFLDFYESLDLEAYPAEVSEALVSVRAHVARRRDGDYRALYARQGCVQDWQVGPLEGHRGPLELERLEIDRGFRVDPEGAEAHELSCAVRVWNPEPRVGIRRMRSAVEVPGQYLRLRLGAQYPSRVYVDDVLIWASDRSDRYPVSEPAFALPTGPGEHVIEVRTTIPSERGWVLVRATDLQGRPLAVDAAAGTDEVEASAALRGSAGADRLARASEWLERAPWAGGELGLRGPVYAPLRSFLALNDALADGDTDRAEALSDELRDRSERFAEAHLLLAEFEHLDPTRAKTSSAARQQAELEAALAIDPSMSRALLSLLSLRLDRGEVAEVVEELEALGDPELPAGLDNLMFHMLGYEAYRRRGSDFRAERALEAAERHHPASCDLLMARRELARERGQVQAEDRIAEQLGSCAGSLGLRARLALRRQRLDEARELWEARLDRIPDDLDVMEALAEVAVAAGDYRRAIHWHEQMLELAPYRALSQVELADLHARADDPKVAREYVLAAIERFPHNSRLREIGERVGVPDELMDWRIDGAEALAEYRADRDQGLASEGVAEVLLLDREVSMLYENGGHRHIVHQMFHILSDQAIDAHGEFNQPGVRLLTMHSIKPDGSIVEPESIAGKDGLSLRGLEIDDVVEIEFIYESGPEPMLPGHVDLGRFRFQSPETPFHRSELIVLVPESMRGEVDVEARNDAPEPTRRSVELREGEFDELSFRARQVPRLGTEPQARSMLDELPMIQVHVPLKVEDWADTLAAQIRPAQRSNPELRALTHELVDEYGDDLDKVDTLWRWVVDEVEEGGDLTTPATVTLAARQGSRLTLLRAMLEEAGVNNELWLLRDRFGPEIYAGGNPLVEVYDTAMLAVLREGQPPLMVGTSSEVVPLGYLSPSYAEGRAVRVQLEGDEGEGGYVQVPKNPARHRNLRRWELDLSLDAQGAGRIRGTIELRGLEAILWRDAFDKFDADKLPEVFTDAELRRMLPMASLDLEQLEFDNEWELDQPLVARFSAKVRNGGVVQGGQLAMLAAAVPIDLATAYTRLPERWSGMVIAYAPVLESRVHVELQGRSFAEVPADVNIEGERGSYTRELVEGGVGERELVFESRSVLEPGVVPVEDYEALARFASQVQAAEQAVLRAR